MDGEMINPNDPNANGQMQNNDMSQNQMNSQMYNNQMPNQFNGQMMNNQMMNGQMQNQFNGQMQNQFNGQMYNNQMPNQMNGQMMNNQMPNQFNGQMMNNQMPNQFNGQMMNNQMPNQFNGQMMNNQMPNQFNGQMYNNQMPNQMNGQMYNQMPNQMGMNQMPNQQMQTQMMYGNPMQNQMPNQFNGQMYNNGMMGNQSNQMMTAAADTAPAVFDEKALLAKMEKEMVNSAEVLNLVRSIDTTNFDAIQMFGKEVMDEMSKVSDAVIGDANRAMLMDNGRNELLVRFKKLFAQIDPSELNDKGGLFGKIFGDIRKKIEAFIARYQKISVDIDGIYVELKNYEEESRAGNRKLATMYEANVNTFHNLKMYIYAAEQCTINIKKEIENQTALLQQTGNIEIKNKIDSLTTAQQLMEKQYSMLLTAQNVALQSLPQINMQQLTNYNIISKVNEYFLIGLPIMKQGIAQAIMLKRQKIMTESLSDMDKKMNEMMIRNAQNTVDTAKTAMQLSNQTSISAETLEETWKIISNGIDEVNKIQQDGSKKRIEDAKKLEKIKSEFTTKLGVPLKSVNN